jgi:hypothetical protein
MRSPRKEQRLGEYEPVPGFGGEKAAENGWALAMATGREPPFSPTGLGAARRADRASVPGYSGDDGPRRDDRDPWRYEDFGRRSQRNTRGKRARASSSKAAGRLAETPRQVPAATVSSARLPGLMGAIPVGSETNALDVLGESGLLRNFQPARMRPADPGAGPRRLCSGAKKRQGRASLGGGADSGRPARSGMGPTCGSARRARTFRRAGHAG